MTEPIIVTLADGQTLLRILRLRYGTAALILSDTLPPDPEFGFEGGRFLNAIKGVLEPHNPPVDQYLKILTPTGKYCSFGVEHVIDVAAGDEIGRYSLEIEDVKMDKPPA